MPIAAPDRDAFRDLYLSTVRDVFAYAARRVGPDEAHDVTAETFARAWRSLPTWEQRGRPVEAWLLTIARNVIVDRWRRTARQPGDAAFVDDVDPSMSQRFDTVVDRTVLVAAMAALSARHRQVLELRFLRDLSVGDTAAVMGVGDEAVRALTYRALRALRAALQAGGDGHAEATGA